MDPKWVAEMSNDNEYDDHDDDQPPKTRISPKRIAEIEIDTQFRRIKIILLRAIGNPLPPRHDPEQAYANLVFTLENEPNFPDLVKVWVLNRLVDTKVLERLQSLISSYGHDYIVIPFNLTEYAAEQYRFDYYDPGGDVVHSPDFVKRDMRSKFYNDIEDAVNQDKSLFVTNQNAARNIMLDFGRVYARNIDWIMPWDGNCYLDLNAYQAIYRQLQSLPPSHNYAISYMHRATANEQVLQDTYRPNATEEPQIIFRRKALGRFHPLLRYGRMNKSEFLQRLQVAGPWDNWLPLLEWEVQHLGPVLQPIPDLQNITTDGPVRSVGYVTRLSSGKPDLEVNGIARNVARFESVKTLLGHLDTKVAIEMHGYRPGEMVYYDEDALERDRELFRDGNVLVTRVVKALRRMAVQAGAFEPWSGNGAPEDPEEELANEVDYIDATTEFRQPSPMYVTDQMMEYDGIRFQEMQRNTTILGLAYFMTGEAQFAKVAARSIRRWFLDPATRTNPDLMIYNEVETGVDTSLGIFGMKDVYCMLDAVRIIERDGYLTETEQRDLRAWFREHLKWLETSTDGKAAYSSDNHVGIFFDVQVIAIASYINDTAKMIWYSERSTSRLHKQMSGDGTMHLGPQEPLCEKHRIALQGWSILSRMAEAVNRNRWTVNARNTTTQLSLLCNAAKYTIPFYGRSVECERVSDGTEDGRQWWPLLQASKYYCPALLLEETQWPIRWFQTDAPRPPLSSYEMPYFYDTNDVIAPFWNLGLVHGNITWPGRP